VDRNGAKALLGLQKFPILIAKSLRAKQGRKTAIGIQKNQWDTDKHSAAAPQPKISYWTQMNTDKHR
jgi:hypothetical protein